MNGLFGTFGRGYGGYMMPQAQVPQQNVANYLRMPVMSAPQQKQYPSINEIVQAIQPQQEDSFANNPAIRRIAGLPQVTQPQTPPSNEALILQRISGYNGNTTS